MIRTLLACLWEYAACMVCSYDNYIKCGQQKRHEMGGVIKPISQATLQYDTVHSSVTRMMDHPLWSNDRMSMDLTNLPSSLPLTHGQLEKESFQLQTLWTMRVSQPTRWLCVAHGRAHHYRWPYSHDKPSPTSYQRIYHTRLQTQVLPVLQVQQKTIRSTNSYHNIMGYLLRQRLKPLLKSFVVVCKLRPDKKQAYENTDN
jgi:hypothetical protein